MIVLLTVGLIKKIELDLCNHVTKPDLKGAAGVKKSNLATKLVLVSSKADIDKIDLDKLKTVL